MIAVVVVGAAAAGIFLSSPHSSTTTSTSSTTTSQTSSQPASPFTISYDAVNVGYSGGLFEIGFQSAATKTVETVVVILSTPTEAALCTGSGYGLQFANCIPGPHGGYVAVEGPPGGYPLNTTFSGFATGKGPGSAIAGQGYSVSITATFTDGTSIRGNYTVTASAGG